MTPTLRIVPPATPPRPSPAAARRLLAILVDARDRPLTKEARQAA